MHGPFVHEALFYRDSDEYLAGTVSFVRRALAQREPVLVAVPGGNGDRVAAALDTRAAGVRFVDMTRAGRNPGKIIPWVLHTFLDEHAGRPVRIVGEPIWAGRSATEYPACVQHEALINMAFAGRVATILCPYDAARLPAAVLADAARTHPVLVAAGTRTDSPRYTHPDAVLAAFNEPLGEPPPGTPALRFGAPGLPRVRDFVARHGGAAGLPAPRVRNLQLAANELATNAILHGGGAGELRMWQTARQVLCEVRDRGRVRGRLAGLVPPAPDAVGGRGLALVNYLSDLVRIHTGPRGTAIRVYVDRLADGPAGTAPL
jgi:anti-sigma regulatory factor (Ser/Thr protein kinase)